jgi:hypothetical protein
MAHWTKSANTRHTYVAYWGWQWSDEQSSYVFTDRLVLEGTFPHVVARRICKMGKPCNYILFTATNPNNYSTYKTAKVTLEYRKWVEANNIKLDKKMLEVK